jgi:hypothetical protein
VPLDLRVAIAGASLWLGLAILLVTILFVRNPRRQRILSAVGLVMVGAAILVLVEAMGFGPDRPPT